jgi:hypothetical protein
MPTRQGDVGLLRHPIAQQLLRSKIPARLAYIWRDGTPRVVPIGFHWNGEEFVLATTPDAPKMKVLKDGAKVALTIDTDAFPPKVLLVRGTVHVDTVDGIAPEYAAMLRRTMGEEGGQAVLEQATALYARQSRIFIHPDWVALQDFETRLPNAVERAMQASPEPWDQTFAVLRKAEPAGESSSSAGKPANGTQPIAAPADAGKAAGGMLWLKRNLLSGS